MRTRRLLLLPVVLVVFLLGLFRDIAVESDSLLVHVVCPEHGELLHASASTHGRAELRKDTPSTHETGCQLAELGTLPSTPPPRFPELATVPVPPILATAAAPRAPPASAPLLRAPKTSPPVV